MPERITRWECENGHTPSEGILVGPTRDRLACPECNTTLSEVGYVRVEAVEHVEIRVERRLVDAAGRCALRAADTPYTADGRRPDRAPHRIQERQTVTLVGAWKDVTCATCDGTGRKLSGGRSHPCGPLCPDCGSGIDGGTA